MEGSAKAAKKWSPEQVEAVDNAILGCIRMLSEFTADDVWSRLPAGFLVTKGLGSRLNSFSKRGMILATDRTRKSVRTDEHGHGQRLTIWRSL
jgi:hypothetical protein